MITFTRLLFARARTDRAECARADPKRIMWEDLAPGIAKIDPTTRS